MQLAAAQAGPLPEAFGKKSSRTMRRGRSFPAALGDSTPGFENREASSPARARSGAVDQVRADRPGRSSRGGPRRAAGRSARVPCAPALDPPEVLTHHPRAYRKGDPERSWRAAPIAGEAKAAPGQVMTAPARSSCAPHAPRVDQVRADRAGRSSRGEDPDELQAGPPASRACPPSILRRP